MARSRLRQRDTSAEILEINILELDREWCSQPKLYCQYAERLATAKRDLDEADAAEDLAVAELDREIRENPGSFGIGKVTEKAVEHAIKMQPIYKRALMAVIDCRHMVNVLQAVVTALDHRKRALESLVSLHGQQYFAAPRTANGKEATEEVLKRGTRKIGRRREDGNE